MDKIEAMRELCDILGDSVIYATEKLRKTSEPVSAGDADYVDKLTHAIKSIETTIAMKESGYSQRGGMYPVYNDGRIYSDGRGGSYRGGSYDDGYNGGSYARGRGSNARRDSMGRYSRDDGELHETLDDLRGMMDGMPEEKRRKVERLISEIER